MPNRRSVTVRPFILAALATLAACSDITVPDLNRPSIENFRSNPTRAGVATIAAGMIRGARDNTATLVLTLGVFGREGYTLNVGNGTLPTYLIGPLSPGDFLSSGLWDGQYSDIRAGNIALAGLPDVADMSPEEKNGATGFLQTMQAFDLQQLIATRDTFGIAIDVGEDPTGPAAPIVSKAEAYTHIFNLLDSARANLQNAGSAFPFALPAGFEGFDTPQTFATFNRALKARLDLYVHDYATALVDLQESFLDTSAPLAAGPVFVFSTNSGDLTNPLYAPFIYANTDIVERAQLRTDGSLDLRAQEKVVTVPPFSLGGVTTDLQFTTYAGPSAPIPIIRNEELILLRAQANLGLNTASSITAALADINLIRVQSGGLPPKELSDFPTDDALLEELLYEKRYSLLWEGGHSWLDRRIYGKLAELPKALPTHHIFEVMPFPLADCVARDPQPKGCSFVNGL
jgi:hypothetical protein